MSNVTLDSETADRITAATIKDHIKLVNANVRRLKAQKKLAPAQLEDLVNDIQILDALKTVHWYFTGK
jgi:hypothetical protein